jgi:quinone-modifying oxidoreductase subunit QmoC
MERPTDIVLESGTRHDFIDELLSVPGGERLNECIQCGTCSGSCPVSYYMDNPPRKLFAMIRAGLRDRVLQSASLWLCTSCYTCTIRCPKQIAVTDIIYALKRLAMSEGKVSGAVKAAALANSFVDVVDNRGRNFEPELLVRYYAKTNPLGLLKKASLGMKLLGRGRMPVRGERIQGLDQIRTIIAKSDEIGGL